MSTQRTQFIAFFVLLLNLPFLIQCDSDPETINFLFAPITELDSSTGLSANSCAEGSDEFDICGDPVEYGIKITYIDTVNCSPRNEFNTCDAPNGVIAGTDVDEVGHYTRGSTTTAEFVNDTTSGWLGASRVNEGGIFEAANADVNFIEAVSLGIFYVEATLPSEDFATAYQGGTLRLCLVDGSNCYAGAKAGDYLYRTESGEDFMWYDFDAFELVAERPTNPYNDDDIAAETFTLGQLTTTPDLRVDIPAETELFSRIVVSAEVAGSIVCLDSEDDGLCNPAGSDLLSLRFPTSFTAAIPED